MTGNNPIFNHLRIFVGFATSTRGMICLVLISFAAFAPVCAKLLATEHQMPALTYLGPLLSVLALFHMVAYLLETIRISETQNIADSLPTIEQRREQSELRERVKHLELELQDAQQQHLDIKQKMPELMQMIIDLREDLSDRE